MKKFIVVALLAAAVSTQVNAQDNNNQERPRFDRTEMLQRRTNSMVEKYGLNDAQKEQLQKLNEEYADVMPMMGPRMRGMGGRGNGPRMNGGRPNNPQGAPQGQPEMRRERGQMQPNQGFGGQGRGNGPGARRFDPEKMKQYEEQLQKIMTPEQYEKYQADHKEMMERMQQMRSQRPQQ